MNKRTEQTRWTPKRLLSLLMALIMTLSLLPTAAFAADSGTAGSSADNPVTVAYSGYGANNRIIVSTAPITKNVPESTEDSAYQIIFKPAVMFKNDTSSVKYKSNIDLEIGVHTSTVDATNTGKERAIGKHTITVQQLDAAGYPVSGASTTFTYTSTDASKVGVSGVYSDGSSLTAKALENNMIRLKYTVYEGDSANESKRVGEVYVGITGIAVTDIEYTITYRPGADAAWATPPTGLSETSESGVYATTVTPGEDGKASYTIDSAASVKKDGHTFVGWRVGANGSTGSVMKAGDTIGGITGDVNLYAELEKNHTITFQSEYSGASGLMTSAPSNGTKYTVPVEPTMYGFTFAGWKVTKTGGTLTATVAKGTDGKWVVDGIDSDITLTAQWTKDGTTPAGSHSVKFVRNNTTDGSALNWPDDLTGAAGDTVTIPWNIPQAEGYTFLGWSTPRMRQRPTITPTTRSRLRTRISASMPCGAKIWSASPIRPL